MDRTPPAPALFNLANKNVLITGATRGIGAACAIALAGTHCGLSKIVFPLASSIAKWLPPEAGAAVCLVVRPGATDTTTLDALRALVTKPHTPHTTVDCDMGDLVQVRTLFTRALATMSSQIDILVNCAGIQRRAPAVDFSEEDWDDAAGNHMLPRKSGKIINFGSLLSFQGGLTVPAYAAAKGGLSQLTKALSNEWAAHNVQVNAICPGYIATEMNERLLADPTRLRQISERIPAGRWGTPADFAGPCVFLASAASNYVSGELLVVDGGWMGR